MNLSISPNLAKMTMFKSVKLSRSKVNFLSNNTANTWWDCSPSLRPHATFFSSSTLLWIPCNWCCTPFGIISSLCFQHKVFHYFVFFLWRRHNLNFAKNVVLLLHLPPFRTCLKTICNVLTFHTYSIMFASIVHQCCQYFIIWSEKMIKQCAI